MSTAARLLETEPIAGQRARLRLVDPSGTHEPPLVSFRTCSSCGERAAFVREDEAGWYACSACGRYG